MLRAWFLLFRPWSYTATVVPFLVAAAVGSVCRDACWWHWAGGLAVGLLFQATVNLLNTWGDERSGVDDVPGAIRTTPQIHDGLVSMRALFAVAAWLVGIAGIWLSALPWKLRDLFRANEQVRRAWALFLFVFAGLLVLETGLWLLR